MLRPDHPALTEPRLRELLRSPDAGLRVEAVRTLRDSRLPGRFDRLAEVVRDAAQPPAVRAEAVAGLAADGASPGTRSLLIDLAAGGDRALRHEALRSLRGVTLEPAERARLTTAAADDATTADLVAALDPPRPVTRATTPAPLADWLARLEGPADPEAGARVFFHAQGPGCYRCHKVDGRGGRVGPELSTTGSALTRERLVESIIDPSKEVAPQFVSWNVALKDGRVLTGVRVGATAEGTVYGDAQGRLVTVRPTEVDEARPSRESVMPADLPKLMTPQEFRDLIAFLRGPRS
jgi:putative heme-binding domain-containing protein